MVTGQCHSFSGSLEYFASCSASIIEMFEIMSRRKVSSVKMHSSEFVNRNCNSEAINFSRKPCLQSSILFYFHNRLHNIINVIFIEIIVSQFVRPVTCCVQWKQNPVAFENGNKCILAKLQKMNFVEYFLCIFLLIKVCLCQENLFTNERIKSGLVLPFQVDALTGEDVFLRMTDTVPNQEKCIFHKNGAMDVSAPVDK